jgi:hypothetical protein
MPFVVIALLSLSGHALGLAQQRAEALSEQLVQTDLGRRLACGSQLLLANELIGREPARARAVLDAEARCPPHLRDVTWNLIGGSGTRELWQAPAESKPARAVGFSAGRLVSLAEDGSVGLAQPGTSQKTETVATVPGTPLAEWAIRSAGHAGRSGSRGDLERSRRIRTAAHRPARRNTPDPIMLPMTIDTAAEKPSTRGGGVVTALVVMRKHWLAGGAWTWRQECHTASAVRSWCCRMHADIVIA